MVRKVKINLNDPKLTQILELADKERKVVKNYVPDVQNVRDKYLKCLNGASGNGNYFLWDWKDTGW